MSSSFERVFSEGKKESAMTFARRRDSPNRIYSEMITILNDVLECITALDIRLDTIEKSVEEIRERLVVSKVSIDLPAK